jgi:S-formylglutathione hydrolase FrmB
MRLSFLFITGLGKGKNQVGNCSVRSLWIVLMLAVFRPAVALPNTDTTFILNYNETPVKTTIHYPAGKHSGVILLLHGWGLPSSQWCEKSTLCKTALQNGFILVVPDFGKTTYHYEVYKETIEKYKAWPTRKWMYETYLPFVRENFGLFSAGDDSFVAGLSTGGRGAALFALEKPDIFIGAACLSADFDQTKISTEPINTGYYGSYQKFPERWSGMDNIYNRVEEMKTSLFIAHGRKDKMCPYSQSKNYYLRLKEKNPGLHVEFVTGESDGHDYLFWEKQTNAILEFFIGISKERSLKRKR